MSFPGWLSKLLADYPALLTGVLGAAVTLLGRFGFHVTEDQLLLWAVAAYTVIAAVVHGGFRLARKHPEA